MANADTDRNDRRREIGALTARVARLESLRQRFVDTGPPSPSSAPTSP
jgi:hypothetical protein